jgi:outer membrane protein assembly factor BamA
VVLHRDFRDYYNRHGGTLYASIFRGRAFEATVSYSDERWGDRRTRDPWTIFRNNEPWRENPVLDEGTFHLVNGTLRYDTRSDVDHPWTGWFIQADYEYGTGTISRYGLAAVGTRTETAGGATAYDRLMVDVRRYNRIAPGSQLNFRLVGGGWLSGDDLPMQRRFSLGGPGTLGGYDFRRVAGRPDVWQCSTTSVLDVAQPIGSPAHCERFAMAQVEYRGDMQFDLFGVLDEERDRRRAGWGRGTEWVAFADVGRGWLVGAPDDGLTYAKGRVPGLSTFRTDVGLGLVLDNVGVYVAKALTDRGAPFNVFVRLRPRF